MNGWSEAKVRLKRSGEEITYRWTDENTSIAASSPMIKKTYKHDTGAYVVAPAPLQPTAFLPDDVPAAYRRDTTFHLLQVISMNMKSSDGSSSLLIGLPYAERFPSLFFSTSLFRGAHVGASSYGAVQSLTNFPNSKTGKREVNSNGYPARSCFAIYHLLETPSGALFNKKPTVMELQPDEAGKLALTLPPIPFLYELINGPIPLYDVREPTGRPVAEVIQAKHGSHKDSGFATPGAWPFHTPDLGGMQVVLAERLRLGLS